MVVFYKYFLKKHFKKLFFNRKFVFLRKIMEKSKFKCYLLIRQIYLLDGMMI